MDLSQIKRRHFLHGAGLGLGRLARPGHPPADEGVLGLTEVRVEWSQVGRSAIA